MVSRTQRKQQIAAKEARPQIIEMRKQGFSIRQIAQHLKMSVGWVHKQERAAMEELQQETQQEASSYRAVQLARYENMLLYLQPKIKKGDIKAIDSARRILDSLSSLMGTNAPTKIAPTTPDGKEQYNPDAMSPEERRKRIEELQRKLGK